MGQLDIGNQSKLHMQMAHDIFVLTGRVDNEYIDSKSLGYQKSSTVLIKGEKKLVVEILFYLVQKYIVSRPFILFSKFRNSFISQSKVHYYTLMQRCQTHYGSRGIYRLIRFQLGQTSTIIT